MPISAQARLALAYSIPLYSTTFYSTLLNFTLLYKEGY